MILVTATPVLLVFPDNKITIKTRATIINPLRNSARLAFFSALFQCCEYFVVLIIAVFRAPKMEVRTSMNITFISYYQNAEQSKENRVGVHVRLSFAYGIGVKNSLSLSLFFFTYFMKLCWSLTQQSLTKKGYNQHKMLTRRW